MRCLEAGPIDAFPGTGHQKQMIFPCRETEPRDGMIFMLLTRGRGTLIRFCDGNGQARIGHSIKDVPHRLRMIHGQDVQYLRLQLPYFVLCSTGT